MARFGISLQRQHLDRIEGPTNSGRGLNKADSANRTRQNGTVHFIRSFAQPKNNGGKDQRAISVGTQAVVDLPDVLLTADGGRDENMVG